MTRLILCLCIALFCAVSNFAKGDELDNVQLHFPKAHQDYAKATVRALRSEIQKEGLHSVARRTDAALDLLVERASKKLDEAGDSEYAYFKHTEWKRQYSGTLTRLMNARDIGDHPTQELSVWLEDFYEHLEFVLGIEVCKALHLSDIKTINCTVKIVFYPCSFLMDSVAGERIDEYRRNFAEGEVYYGLVPVLSFWAVEIAMMAGGIPVPFVAGGVEFMMGKFVAPKLSDAIFTRVCM